MTAKITEGDSKVMAWWALTRAAGLKVVDITSEPPPLAVDQSHADVNESALIEWVFGSATDGPSGKYCAFAGGVRGGQVWAVAYSEQFAGIWLEAGFPRETLTMAAQATSYDGASAAATEGEVI